MDIEGLLQGNEEFVDEYVAKNRDLFEKLANAQHPIALFITCCDSRIAPHLMTATSPGTLFVARNIGNFVPPYAPQDRYNATASAIEYAILALKVDHIIVCGHTQCGAIKALYENIPPTMPAVKSWLEQNRDLANTLKKRFQDKEQLLRATEVESLKLQLNNLLTYPYVKERFDEGNLTLHGWYYHVGSGKIEVIETRKSS